MAQGRKLDPEVVAAILSLASIGVRAKEIRSTLLDRPAYRDRAPEIRTIQNYLRLFAVGDKSEPWSMADEVNDEDARVVLDVLAVAVSLSRGKETSVTKGQAEWVVKVSRATPGLDPEWVRVLAQAYHIRQAMESDTADLDCFLAYRPWQGRDEALRYYLLVEEGSIPRAPVYVGQVGPGLDGEFYLATGIIWELGPDLKPRSFALDQRTMRLHRLPVTEADEEEARKMRAYMGTDEPEEGTDGKAK